jgi:ABC-type branched-subunit amino acid transport system ATPase component
VSDHDTVRTDETAELAPTRDAGSAGDVPALRCRGIDVAYGPVQVLFGVDVDIRENEIVALLGTNGAGKSTLLKAVSGLVRPTAGTVEYFGEDITGKAANQTAAKGLIQMPGGKGVFPTLSVAENLKLACWLLRKDRKAAAAARDEVMDLFPILAKRAGQLAGNLSGGEQQMLSLAQVFINRPRILLIDELSLGLAPAIVSELTDVVRTIHQQGVTIVVVEQSVNVALTLAERAVFMEKGQVRFEGPTADLLERPDILRSVFIAGDGPGDDGEDGGAGEDDQVPHAEVTEAAGVEADDAAGDGEPTATILETRGLVKRFGGITAVNGVDLRLHEQQVLGLVGQNGAGKTTLFDIISGFLEADEGQILYRGVEITDWPAHERARNRLGRSFQDARLYPMLTVAETITVSLERHLGSRDIVAAAMRLPASLESELIAAERVDELTELMGLGGYRDTLVGELSTGTRRVVELACILAQDPSVLLLDEPSGGVAQKETEALGPLLKRVQSVTGCAIMVIEHDMPLLRSICDEMYALELGGVIAQGTPDHVLNHPRVIESYLGTDDAAINRSGAATPAQVS